MARLQISSGKRGRPLSIDPDKELGELLFKNIPKAKIQLEKMRQETHGIRGVDILGSETELPTWLESSIDALQNLRDYGNIEYDTLKELKRNLQSVKQLASKQERVFGRALDNILTTDYEQRLDYFAKNSSSFVKKMNQNVKDYLKNLTSKERQSFFMSNRYQDPATMTPHYREVLAWAKKNSGEKEMTMDEAWAYVRYRRAVDGLMVGD